MAKKKTADQQMRERLAKESTERAVTTRRIATPAVSATDLHEAFSDLESIDVLDRRLKNPNADEVLPIRLVDEPPQNADPLGVKRKWYLRWFNTAIPNRFHAATASLGYVPVLWKELQNREIVHNAFVGSDQVRRGERGVEVLCKMPMAYYTAIKAKQREKHNRRMTPKALREQVASEAVKRGLDPEQDDSVGGIIGDIRERRDRVVSPDDRDDVEQLV